MMNNTLYFGALAWAVVFDARAAMPMQVQMARATVFMTGRNVL
jgi:hypothetical protein